MVAADAHQLRPVPLRGRTGREPKRCLGPGMVVRHGPFHGWAQLDRPRLYLSGRHAALVRLRRGSPAFPVSPHFSPNGRWAFMAICAWRQVTIRSEEQTSELQSLITTS